jgi:hypothetical protein
MPGHWYLMTLDLYLLIKKSILVKRQGDIPFNSPLLGLPFSSFSYYNPELPFVVSISPNVPISPESLRLLSQRALETDRRPRTIGHLRVDGYSVVSKEL